MSTSFSEHYSLLSLPSSHQLPPLDPKKKSNKISDIVKLKRMLKKWRKQANSSSISTPTLTTTTKPKNLIIGRSISFNNIHTSISSSDKRLSSKGITFLKRTLSFPDNISTTAAAATLSPQGIGNIPKGYLAVDVGEEMKRFAIPMSYLRHKVFVDLLKEAEEEFGFQTEGVLRIPCGVAEFELILKGLELAKQSNRRRSKEGIHECISVEIPSSPPHELGTGRQYHPASPMCR